MKDTFIVDGAFNLLIIVSVAARLFLRLLFPTCFRQTLIAKVHILILTNGIATKQILKKRPLKS